MPRTSLSDHEIDRQAKAYARDHRVNYSEALARVVKFAESLPATGSAAEPEPDDDAQAEAELHAKAQRYAAENKVSYAAALNAVVQAGKQAADRPAPRGATEADDQLDRRAKAYALDKGVSYAEALHSVCFAEAFATGPNLLGAAPLEIFRAGPQISDAGEQINFTPADIQAIAKNYTPAKHEAPLVIGHPENDKPAYGWVKQLEATPDGRLLMHAHQVDADYAELVKSGKFKKRSASFYAPNDRTNPTPGSWYLRHVGSLGAVPPAVKGMPDAQFSVGGVGVGFTFGM